MSEIRTVAVAGAGTMGSGIAIVAARAGFTTYLFDTNEETLRRARKQTEGFFAKSVAKGKLSEEQVSEILGRMQGTTNMDDLHNCDLVIEAVFEDLQVKHDLFSRLNEICPEHTIFASNTSTLSISEIAGGSGRSDRVVGMHF
ncbi:3-hydroxybutyryl-CoA dehydrogenase, partial [Marinobacter sp. Z-F4-2]